MSTALLAVGAVIIILAALDVILLENYKKKIADMSVLIWNLIDDAKRRYARFVAWALRWRIEWLVSLFTGLLFVYGCVRYNTSEYILYAAIFPPLGCFITSRFLITTRNPLIYILRSMIVFGTFFVAIIATSSIASGRFTLEYYGPPTPLLVSLIFVSVGIVFAWTLTALPLFVIHGVSALIWIIELFLRGIAQYSKGPIVAIGALLAGIAVALKVMS